MEMWKNVVWISLYLVTITTVYSQTVKDGFKNLKHHKKLSSYMIGYMHQISFLDCVEECLVRKRCKSINYIRRFLTCEMNRQAAKDESKLVNNTDYIYSDMMSFPREMVGQCKENSCGVKEKCVRTSLAGKRCEKSDCGLPRVQAGQVFYDRIDVESRVEYTCNFDEHEKYRYPMICEGTGQWKMEYALPEQSCQDYLKKNSSSQDGYYVIRIGLLCSMVFCDMDNGGWTYIQQRVNGTVDFNKTWEDYRKGFGDITGDFWLGNDMIWALTKSLDRKLRIELWDGSRHKYQEYSNFYILKRSEGYKLRFGVSNGKAGESFNSYSNNAQNKNFSTFDRDSCLKENCGAKYKSGWWFDWCHSSNLNGEFGNNNGGHGINWYTFYNKIGNEYTSSLSKAKMKVK